MVRIPVRERSADMPTVRTPEEIVCQLRPGMWRNRPFSFLACLLLVTAPAAVLIASTKLRFDLSVALSWSLVPAGLGVAMFFIWHLRCSSTEVTITSRRTILRRGFLGRSTTEVRHCDVRSIQVSQTLWQRICGIGHICISSEAEDDHDIRVSGIPHPQRIAETIRQMQP